MTDLITEARELCDDAQLEAALLELKTMSGWLNKVVYHKPGIRWSFDNNNLIHWIVVFMRLLPELCDALEKAQAVMWIPITERLPEQHVDVLVCGTEAINNVKYLCVVKCLDGNVFRPLSAPSVTWTHWMPLPVAPKEGEQDGN